GVDKTSVHAVSLLSGVHPPETQRRQRATQKFVDVIGPFSIFFEAGVTTWTSCPGAVERDRKCRESQLNVGHSCAGPEPLPECWLAPAPFAGSAFPSHSTMPGACLCSLLVVLPFRGGRWGRRRFCSDPERDVDFQDCSQGS